MNIIVLISKYEAFQLQQMGYRFGAEVGLHKSKSRYPKYYLTQTKRTLNDLRKIRKANLVK